MNLIIDTLLKIQITNFCLKQHDIYSFTNSQIYLIFILILFFIHYMKIFNYQILKFVFILLTQNRCKIQKNKAIHKLLIVNLKISIINRKLMLFIVIQVLICLKRCFLELKIEVNIFQNNNLYFLIEIIRQQC